MNSLFWSRAHGGATHFPIALILGATLFDLLAFFSPRSAKRREFNAIGYWLVILGALGSFGAVFTGLALSKWTVGGTGLILRHHLFVWPAFTVDRRRGHLAFGGRPATIPARLRHLPVRDERGLRAHRRRRILRRRTAPGSVTAEITVAQ